MEQRDPERLLTEIRTQARIQEQEAIAELQALAHEVGPERLFITTLHLLAFGPPGAAAESTHGTVPVKVELLAYYLYPLFGTGPSDVLTPEKLDRTVRVLGALLNTYMQGNGEEQPADGPMVSGDQIAIGHLHLDARVVRGSAYPEQTMQEISEIQGSFEGWFAKRAGIGPRRAIEVLLAVVRAEEDSHHEWRMKLQAGAAQSVTAWKEARQTKKRERTAEQVAFLSAVRSSEHASFLGYAHALATVPPDEVPIPRQAVQLIPAPTEDEWQGLITLIGCTPEQRALMDDPVKMQRRPLFVLPENRLLLCDISNAVDQLWNGFEEIARRDQAFYSGAYRQRRSKWLESRTAELIERVFPTEAIYRNLVYPDPDAGPNATTELDLAIDWPPFLVVVEAKAAQFRFESQLGNRGRLRSDIKDNVSDAFEQARRANRYIQSVAEAVFRERDSQRTLRVRQGQLQRVYLTTVSLHHLAGLATRLASVRGLGLFQDGEYPWAISVADLDIVTQFCPGPDVFLHYIERRLAVQQQPVPILGDEMELFGAYLKTRLQASRIWEPRGSQRPDYVWLSGYQAFFDAIMAQRREQRPEGPQIRLELPSVIESILEELRSRPKDKDARWIAFSLLGLTDRILDSLATAFRDLRAQSLKTDAFRRMSFTEEDLAISIVATQDQPAEALWQNTSRRTLLEKHRRKCTRSIGFGVMTSDRSKPFECAVWTDWPWKEDPQMDELIKDEPMAIPVPGSKIPGRNDPCLCGSGRKFKKCCLSRIEAHRRP